MKTIRICTRQEILCDPSWENLYIDLPKWVERGTVEITTNRITWMLEGDNDMWLRVTGAL